LYLGAADPADSPGTFFWETGFNEKSNFAYKYRRMNRWQNFIPRKPIYLYGLLLLALAPVISGALGTGDSRDYDGSRREILMRRLGHELLLQSGDSTSRLPAVKKSGADGYLISFGHEIAFVPDSLVNTAVRVLGADPLASDYVVRVLNCSGSSAAYGFAISRERKNDIVACTGRIQPRACYMIEVKFRPAETGMAYTGYLLGGLSLAALAGAALFGIAGRRKSLPREEGAEIFEIGSVRFDAGGQKLAMNGDTRDLTGTETRLLRIFALSPNQVIERNRLQKEIWEDEGIIVGRSLDMFISKLRKKLESCPDVRIGVVRGKGYRLETGPGKRM